MNCGWLEVGLTFPNGCYITVSNVSAGYRTDEFKNYIRNTYSFNVDINFTLHDNDNLELIDTTYLYESKSMLYGPFSVPTLQLRAVHGNAVNVDTMYPAPANVELEIYDEDDDDDVENLDISKLSLEMEHEHALLSMNSKDLGGIPEFAFGLFKPQACIINGLNANITYNTVKIAYKFAKTLMEAFEGHKNTKRKIGDTNKTPKSVLLAKALFTSTKSVNESRFFDPPIEHVNILLIEGIVSHSYIEENPNISTELEYLRFLNAMRVSYGFILRHIHKLKPHLQRFISYSRQYWPRMHFKVNNAQEVLTYVRTFGELLLKNLKENGVNNSPKSFIKQAKVVLTVVSRFQGWNVNANLICNTDAFTKQFDSNLREIIREDYGSLTTKNRIVESTLNPRERASIMDVLFSTHFTCARKREPIRTMQLQVWIAMLTSMTGRGCQNEDVRFCNIYAHPMGVIKNDNNKHYSTPCLTSCDLPFNKPSGSTVTHLVSVDHIHVCYDVGFMFTAYFFKLARSPMNGDGVPFFRYLSSYLETFLDNENPVDSTKIPEWYSFHIFGNPHNWKQSNRESVEDLFRLLLPAANVTNKDKLSYLFRNTGVKDAMAAGVPNDWIGHTSCHENSKSTNTKYYAKGGVTPMNFSNAERGSREKYFTNYDFLFDTSIPYSYGLEPLYSKDDTLPYQRDLSSYTAVGLEWKQLKTIPIKVIDAFFPGLEYLLNLRYHVATQEINPYTDSRLDSLLTFLLYKGIPQFFSRIDEVYSIDSDGCVDFNIPENYSIAAINNTEFKYACTNPHVISFFKELVLAKQNHIMISSLILSANENKHIDFHNAVTNYHCPVPFVPQVAEIPSTSTAEPSATVPVSVTCPFSTFKCKISILQEGCCDMMPFFDPTFHPWKIYRFWIAEPAEFTNQLDGRMSLREYDRIQHASFSKHIKWEDLIFNPSDRGKHTSIYSYMRNCCLWIDKLEMTLDDKMEYISTLTENFACRSNQTFFLMLAIILGISKQAVNPLRYKKFIEIYELYTSKTHKDFIFHGFSKDDDDRYTKMAEDVRAKQTARQTKS